jgi:hypothetical protein
VSPHHAAHVRHPTSCESALGARADTSPRFFPGLKHSMRGQGGLGTGWLHRVDVWPKPSLHMATSQVTPITYTTSSPPKKWSRPLYPEP